METRERSLSNASADAPAWLSCLRQRARELLELAAHQRRHAEMLESVEQISNAPREVLELAYDLAQEARLDPAIGLALIGCGVAVIELEPPTGSVAEEAHSLNPPDWVAPQPPEPERVLERRLRLTFRRMHALLERHEGDLFRAIDGLKDEPDVTPYNYGPDFGV